MCSMKLKKLVIYNVNFFLPTTFFASLLNFLKIILFNWETQKAKNVQSLTTKLNAN